MAANARLMKSADKEASRAIAALRNRNVRKDVLKYTRSGVSQRMFRGHGRTVAGIAGGGGLVLSAYSIARAKSTGRNGLVPGSTGGNTGIYGM